MHIHYAQFMESTLLTGFATPFDSSGCVDGVVPPSHIISVASWLGVGLGTAVCVGSVCALHCWWVLSCSLWKQISGREYLDEF